MRQGSGHKRRSGIVTAFVALATVMGADAYARDPFSGRMYLTYQDNDAGGLRQEYFSQHYELSLRERLFERNDLALTLFYDDTDNRTLGQSYRRYWGQLALRHRAYDFNWRYAPQQEITPIGDEGLIRERTENELSLDVHPRDYPRLRVLYAKRNQYDQDFTTPGTVDFRAEPTGSIEDVRADLSYRYDVFDFQLNRWHSQRENGIGQETDVLGGSVRMVKTFNQYLTVNSGYQYQENQTHRGELSTTTVTNHTVNGVLNSAYRDLVRATLSGTFRRLETKNDVSVVASDFVTTENDNVIFLMRFLPTRPYQIDVSRTYIASRQNGRTIQSDYGTLQGVLDGELFEGTRGRAQVTLREDINTYGGGVLPPNIYYLTLRSKIYEGIDLRGDINVTERKQLLFGVERYQMTSLLDLYLRPRRSLLVTPHVQYIKFDDDVTFLRNDRADYSVTSTWFITQFVNVGFDWKLSRITVGQVQDNKSWTVNANARLLNRSSLSASYGVNDIDIISPATSSFALLDNQSRSLSVQAQVWLSHKGSLSVNYTSVKRDLSYDSENLAVSYRLDF